MAEHIPVVNRPAAIEGTTITFLGVAWIAIMLRLYVRFVKTRMAGWDDLCVVLAGVAILAGSVITCLMPEAGMGKHMNRLTPGQLIRFFKYVFASNLSYAISTTLIKLAILLQYLRLFDMRNITARRLTVGMISFVAVWGLTFTLLILLSCVPVQKNWDVTRPGKCVAFGVKGKANGNELYSSFAAHAGSNMLLDILILVLPIPFLRSLRMGGKTKIGIIALFVMGTIVAILSIVRMFSLSTNRVGTIPYFDPTFHTPPIYVFSVLEVNVAILTASIPIFWPLVSSLAGNKILVVNEIEVRSSQRDSQMGLTQRTTTEDDNERGMDMAFGTGFGLGFANDKNETAIFIEGSAADKERGGPISGSFPAKCRLSSLLGHTSTHSSAESYTLQDKLVFPQPPSNTHAPPSREKPLPIPTPDSDCDKLTPTPLSHTHHLHHHRRVPSHPTISQSLHHTHKITHSPSLGHRTSQDSSRGLNPASEPSLSSPSLSLNAEDSGLRERPEPDERMDLHLLGRDSCGPRTAIPTDVGPASLQHYQDSYVREWGIPDFEGKGKKKERKKRKKEFVYEANVRRGRSDLA